MGFPVNSAGKESTYNTGDPGLIPGGMIPWRRDRLPTTVFLGFPGGSDGKRNLVGYSPCGCKESGMTERVGTAHVYFLKL